MGQIIDKATGFCINILRQEQEALSTYFAGGWRESTLPLFSFLPWEGGPRLEGSAASIGCVIDGVHEGGDHWIVVGRVVALRASHGSAPLVFFGGRYATIMATSEAQVLVSGF
jgi:flavin reductase (DIM6/NTAB) family NADH-FMN oxidoreductase RutF